MNEKTAAFEPAVVSEMIVAAIIAYITILRMLDRRVLLFPNIAYTSDELRREPEETVEHAASSLSREFPLF